MFGLPQVQAYMAIGLVVMAIGLAVAGYVIKNQHDTISAQDDLLTQKQDKIDEIGQAAASYERQCEKTIAALDKIQAREAAQKRNLENELERIKNDPTNGDIAPVLRDTLDRLLK